MIHVPAQQARCPLNVTAEKRTVAAAFDLSYQYLPADRHRFFRGLGAHPGVDIDAYAAALAGILPDQATGHLAALHGDHLLDEPVYRRYRTRPGPRLHHPPPPTSPGGRTHRWRPMRPRQGRHRNRPTQLRQALEICQRIGAAEATQLATDLADLQAE